MKRKPTKEHMIERKTKYEDCVLALADHIQKIQDTIIILRTEQEINQEIADFNEHVIRLNLFVDPSKSTNLFGLMIMFKKSYATEPSRSIKYNYNFYWDLDAVTKVEQAIESIMLESEVYINRQFYSNRYHF